MARRETPDRKKAIAYGEKRMVEPEDPIVRELASAKRSGRATESDPPPISPQNIKRAPKRTMRSVSGRMSVTRPKFALPNVPFGLA